MSKKSRRLERNPDHDVKRKTNQYRTPKALPAPDVTGSRNIFYDAAKAVDEAARTHDRQMREAAAAQDKYRRELAAHRAEAPVFSECVVGYREWILDPLDQLWPLSGYGLNPWVPGAQTAKCNAHQGSVYGVMSTGTFWPYGGAKPAPHKAPGDDCDCGFYCWRRPRQIESGVVEGTGQRLVVIAGAVAVWGDIQVHKDGFRAETACIVALADDDGREPLLQPALRRVAERYGVDLVPRSELEQSASRHGSPVPDSLEPPLQPQSSYTFSIGGTWQVSR